jgi:ribonuclease P protein component
MRVEGTREILPMRETPVPQTLRPTDRLKRRADYQRVQSTGRKIHTAHFVVAVLVRPEGGPTRLGITATRKVAPAVGRNRIKRVMREVFRRNRELFPSACDVVAIAKDGAHALGYDEVLAELRGAGRALATAHLPRERRDRGPRPSGGSPQGGTP